ncbi:hypothetical protein HAX54_045843 [Datura stramonium]|uniref:Peptidase S9 prolyl oligopeptidase catalytic domain-containing protein n=1 Tax=Datura stramonium TaxID=4076 RepID=A0ABS8WIA6_DATST|nr:hypothetical protein [Datura stramonium]
MTCFSSQLIRPSMATVEIGAAAAAAKLRSQFLNVLRSRRPSEVPLSVVPGKPVKDPFFQETPKPNFSEAMASCPKEDIPNFKELLQEENFYLTTEEGGQGLLPVLVLSMKESEKKRRPTIVFLHSTNKCKEWLRPLLEGYASRGYMAVAIDSRYHGERATSMTTYRDALVSSWKNGDTMPFIFDTVWDLIKLADYLAEREDVDPSKIGITGESLGGMHAWFAAFVDTRYSVVVPIIGVQGFGWAVEHDKWQARVNSIKAVFEEARADLDKSAIDKEVVQKVWDRIAPGLASQFDDAPYIVLHYCTTPRYWDFKWYNNLQILNNDKRICHIYYPSIIKIHVLFSSSCCLKDVSTWPNIIGEDDPRCPIDGLKIPELNARKAWEETNCPQNFKLIAHLELGIK